MILEVKNLVVGYPPNKIVLRDVSLSINVGQIVALTGHNGAGKTTLLNTVFGLLRPHAGKVLFRGREITSSTSAKVKAGFSYSPQGHGVFPSLSIMENLEVAVAYLRLNAKEFQQRLEATFNIFPILGERKQQRAGTLSGGQQRMLAVGMPLMQRPSLLLLDEPSLGLSPVVAHEMLNVIQKINDELDVSVLLVEQNLEYAFRLADKLYILKLGQITFSGDKDILLNYQQLWDKL